MTELTTQAVQVDVQSPRNELRLSGPRLPYHPAIEERFGIDRGTWKFMTDILYPTAEEPETIINVLAYCKARKLDPLKKPVHVVPVWDKKRGKMVDSVWPSISEVRITATRTGLYAGRDETVFGPDKTEKLSEVEVTYPEWAQVTVYRFVAGQACAFVGEKVRWKEYYAKAGRNTLAPNDMWKTKTYSQIAKCAEANALRCAFPEEDGGPTAEEMHGQEVESLVSADHSIGSGVRINLERQLNKPTEGFNAAALEAALADTNDVLSPSKKPKAAKKSAPSADLTLADDTPHHPETGEVIEGKALDADGYPVEDEETFACLDSIAGPAPRGESYTLLDDDDDGETLPLYIDGVEVGRVNPEQSAEYNAYTEHAPTDEEAAASPPAEAGADLPDGWEVLKDVDGPAPIGEDFYILAGDIPDEKTLRLTTYRNGVAASSCGKVGAAKLVRYTSHPVSEGAKAAADVQTAENVALAEPDDDEDFPGDRPASGAGDGGDELPGAFGVFWTDAFSGDPPWADFVKAWGDLNKSGDWTDLDDDDDRNAFRAKIAAKLLALNRLPDVTSNITAFRLWLEFASDGEVIAEKWRELKQSDVWTKFKPDRQTEFRATVEQRLAKIGGA